MSTFTTGPQPGRQPPLQGFYAPFRMEVDLRDCEVQGRIPEDLRGSFYRIGPDFQYPPRLPNIPFDGEGHLGVFRFADGHVDYRSRYVRTQRYKAQAAAREALFGTYRNPYTDDARVAGLSRGTANTGVVFHHGKLLVLKEDSPPVVVDAESLETLDDYYTFDGQLRSLTFTAHPKIDSETGELVAFGYEARGEATDDVAVMSFDRNGRLTWEAWIKVPYVGLLHDFAVTRTHVAFLAIPMATNVERMKQGQVHFAWDSSLPTWFGVLRRGGDGSDLRWFKGPERCATHTMGTFSDGTRLYVDMDMAETNQFPFFPNVDGAPFNPVRAQGHVTRLSVDLEKSRPDYEMEILYPENGILSRQDDRYHTVPYGVGFMPTLDVTRPLEPKLATSPMRPFNCWTRFDHAQRRTTTYFPGPDSSVQECCFVPRHARAAEGDGYLVGVVNRWLEGRNDLLVLDATRLEDGPLATVRLPTRIHPQIHGWWVPDEQKRDGGR